MGKTFFSKSFCEWKIISYLLYRNSSEIKNTSHASEKTKNKNHMAKKATKKAAPKKAAKKPAAKKARTPNAAFMKPLQPSAALAEVVGSKPIPRTEIVKKMWAYIKKNNLQDKKNRRMINADAKLKPIFAGKGQVSMFDMAKLLSKQVK
jgi:upstream activation factor subunit UAF30